MNISIDGTIWK